MGHFDTLIKHGTVITANGVEHVDIGVVRGRIAAIGNDLGTADQLIDASGRYVVPGGIDSHCHIEQETSTGLVPCDDFYSATLAAACGGTTTVIPFACQHRGQSLSEAVSKYHTLAEKAVVDYAFHMIVTDPSQETLAADIPELANQGYTSIKIYMTYDRLRLGDYDTLNVLETARNNGSIVMIHAENHDMIRWLTERLLAEGKSTPRYHARAGHPLAEREAAHRVISFSELVRAPVLIVHVSGAMTVEQLKAARKNGVPVAAETCPHYLVLAEQELGRPGFEGAKFLCCPPLRSTDDNDAMWTGLQEGVLSVVSSDHSAYNFHGQDGKAINGEGAPFNKVPMGLPGLEARLPVLFSEGVTKGKIGIERFVELSSTNHAKLYGLYPRKGVIAEGADADLVLWDADKRWLLTPKTLHDGVDYTPYDGLELTGAPVLTMSRGDIIFDGVTATVERGRGLFLPAAKLDASIVEAVV